MTTREEYEAWAKNAVHKNVGDLLWDCWKTAADKEREECAKLCKDIFAELCDKIRERSNAEITGSPKASPS